MSQNQQQLSAFDTGRTESTEDQQGSFDQTERLVPVSEAIKYRKRAQTAEQRIEQLDEQLRENERQQQETQKQLEEATSECEIMQKLMQAGAADMEVALVLTKQRLQSQHGDGQEVDSVIEELHAARPYLFGESRDPVRFGSPTSGVRSEDHGSLTSLKRMAEKAASSGDRRDVQQYLRLRRSVKR